MTVICRVVCSKWDVASRVQSVEQYTNLYMNSYYIIACFYSVQFSWLSVLTIHLKLHNLERKRDGDEKGLKKSKNHLAFTWLLFLKVKI